MADVGHGIRMRGRERLEEGAAVHSGRSVMREMVEVGGGGGGGGGGRRMMENRGWTMDNGQWMMNDE